MFSQHTNAFALFHLVGPDSLPNFTYVKFDGASATAGGRRLPPKSEKVQQNTWLSEFVKSNRVCFRSIQMLLLFFI